MLQVMVDGRFSHVLGINEHSQSIVLEEFELLWKHLVRKAKDVILARMEANGGLVLQDLTTLLQADLIDADTHVSWDRMGQMKKKEERHTEQEKSTTEETFEQRNSDWFKWRPKLNLSLRPKSIGVPLCEPWCDAKLRPAMHVLAAWLAFAAALGLAPAYGLVLFGCPGLDFPKWLLERRRIMQRLPWWAEGILLLLHALVHGTSHFYPSLEGYGAPQFAVTRKFDFV